MGRKKKTETTQQQTLQLPETTKKLTKVRVKFYYTSARGNKTYKLSTTTYSREDYFAGSKLTVCIDAPITTLKESLRIEREVCKTLQLLHLTAQQKATMLEDFKNMLENTTAIGKFFEIKLETGVDKLPKAIVRFSKTAEDKYKSLVKTCLQEVGFHGIITKTQEKDNKDVLRTVYNVEDILVFPQEVTAATVDADEVKYGMWCMQQPDEVFNKMRFHGHSHVNMGVSPSGTDTTYQTEMVKDVEDFYVFMIVNKSNTLWWKIIDKTDNLVYDTADIEVQYACNPMDVWASEQLTEWVTHRTIVAPAMTTAVNPAVSATATEAAQAVLDKLKNPKTTTDEEKKNYDRYADVTADEYLAAYYGGRI